MKLHAVLLSVTLALGACIEVETGAPAPQTGGSAVTRGVVSEAVFNRVVARVIPVAEAECRTRTSGLNCDFQVGLDRRTDQQPNAYQTLGSDGRPQIVANVALLNDLQNQDELAFILGHETAHHIRGHLAATNRNAATGAVLGGVLAAVLGAEPGMADTAMRAGAAVGARSYSKNYELAADALGTIIAKRAGYDPVLGAQYFARIPDPGNKVLGTHPPNADRMATVRRTAGQY